MAYAMPSRVLALLNEIAEPLARLAYAEAGSMVAVHEGATEHEIERSHAVLAASMALQAVLRAADQTAKLGDFELAVVLATVSGTVLAQVQDPAKAFPVFKTQMANVLREVTEATLQGSRH